MIRQLFISAATVAALLSAARADQIVEAQDGGVITGYVSETGVTRLSFVGDQAASIQMASGGTGPGFSIAHEPQTGDLYLTLEGAGSSRIGAASFFVTTRSGFTYQVELAAKATPSTQITIRNPELTRRRAAANTPSDDIASPMVALTRAMWSGALAEGYELRRIAARERVAGSLRIRPVLAYEGDRLTGRIFEVRNPAPGDVAVDESLFLAPGVLAVSVQGPRTLPRNGRGRVLVVEGGAP